jgi:hypothetical protein
MSEETLRKELHSADDTMFATPVNSIDTMAETIVKKPVENRCGNCFKDSEDGIICDKCADWWCTECINSNVENTLTPILYLILTGLGDFQWECESCNPTNLLPLQLKVKKTVTLAELLNSGVNPAALKPQKKQEETKYF